VPTRTATPGEQVELLDIALGSCLAFDQAGIAYNWKLMIKMYTSNNIYLVSLTIIDVVGSQGIQVQQQVKS
jgi:hypothetical protein